jgi:MoaA/NifB/PqqE/SkfB family radical SAM enzyme
MTTEQAKTIIRQSEAAGVVTVVFTGGEPMLRKDLYELISYVNKDEAVALIFSNGIMLSEENVRKLKDAGLWGICVSIDSPDAEAHDALRKVPGCFQKATAGLKRAKEAGIMTAISTYATPERLRTGQIQQMIKLSEDVGVDELIIFDVVPTGRLLKQDARFLLSPEDQKELCRIEEEQNAKHVPPQIITQAHVNGPTGVGCYAGWCQFYVTAYGDMTPCDFTPVTFGNVIEEDVDTVWAKMTAHEAYCKRSNHCRMQDPEFRAKFIDRIPVSGPFPFPASNLAGLPEVPIEVEEIDTEASDYSSIGIKA